MTVNIVISPHCDDAVVSLGGYIADKDCIVLTVFAAVPDVGTLSDYDRACGFDSSTHAMWQRRYEDDNACGVLGARPIRMPFFDRQYGIVPDLTELQRQLVEFIVPELFCPLGIGHPDHVTVAKTVRDMIPDGEQVLLYEELPYRVLWPEQVFDALELVRAEGFTIEPFELLPHDVERKQRAIGCYKSQQFPRWTAEIPERVHRATRCG